MILIAAACVLVSCGQDKLSDESIFKDTEVEKTDFDRWVSGELVAHAKNEKETVCSGNYWAYGYDLEYAPASEQDEIAK